MKTPNRLKAKPTAFAIARRYLAGEDIAAAHYAAADYYECVACFETLSCDAEADPPIFCHACTRLALDVMSQEIIALARKRRAANLKG